MKYFSFCTALFFLVIAFACWQDPASSTSTAPAAAPEKMFSHTPGAIDDKLTYIPGERFGKLSGITLEGDLEFLYGEEIKPAVIDLGEGFTVAGYRLFPERRIRY
jgi:hypothetical protein